MEGVRERRKATVQSGVIDKGQRKIGGLGAKQSPVRSSFLEMRMKPHDAMATFVKEI